MDDSRRVLEHAFAAAIREERLGQAYLFRGPRGAGKYDFALALVAALECQVGDGLACRACPGCRPILSGNHPDLLIVSPEEGRQRLTIAQMRLLVEDMSRRAWNGRGRRAIIDPAERMTDEAASCLLRPLEEPPPGALFLLLTSQPEAILPTIRSRSTEVFFGPRPAGEIEGRLVGELGLDPARAAALAELAEGDWERALRVADPDHAALREAFLDALLAPSPTAGADLLARIKTAGVTDGVVRGRIDALLEELLSLLRLVHHRAATGQGAGGQAAPDAARTEALVALGRPRVRRLVERTVALRERLAQQAHVALALECYASDVALLLPKTR